MVSRGRLALLLMFLLFAPTLRAAASDAVTVLSDDFRDGRISERRYGTAPDWTPLEGLVSVKETGSGGHELIGEQMGARLAAPLRAELGDVVTIEWEYRNAGGERIGGVAGEILLVDDTGAGIGFRALLSRKASVSRLDVVRTADGGENTKRLHAWQGSGYAGTEDYQRYRVVWDRRRGTFSGFLNGASLGEWSLAEKERERAEGPGRVVLRLGSAGSSRMGRIHITTTAPTPAAEQPKPEPVEVRPLGVIEDKALKVTHGGRLLIEADELVMADWSEARLSTFSTGDWNGMILEGGTPERCAYYREVAHQPGRVEVTWNIEYPSTQYGVPDGISFPTDLNYSIRIPAELVDGGRFKAASIDHRGGGFGKLSISEGEFSPDLPEGEMLAPQGIMYLALTTPDGGAVTLNLNPKGLHAVGPIYSQLERNWKLTRQGDHYRLSAHFGEVAFGDTREFKILITDGPWRYEELQNDNRKTNVVLAPQLSLAFGTASQRGYTPAGVERYDARRGFGWLENGGLTLRETEAPGLYQSHVRSAHAGRKDFQIDIADGLYLVHVAFGSPTDGSGRFDVLINDERKLADRQTAPGRFLTQTTYGWARGGKLTVSVEGEGWMLNGIGLTRLLADHEDYHFTRGWWVQPERFERWIDATEPTPPLPAFAFEPQREDRLDWTWNSSVETLEGSINWSRRAALETPAAIEGRIREIASGGYGAVRLDGLHFRFASIGTKRNDILLRNDRLAVETAHRHGMKVIAHYDLNWVLYDGFPRLLRILDEDPNALPRSVVSPFVVQANFCLNSKAFFRECVDYVSEHLEATGLDGLMIDEMTFYADQYCGCDTCRTGFREDTGLELPYGAQDERGVFLQNADHPAWRAWIKWRGTKEGEFVLALKEKSREVNPNVVWTSYTSRPLSSPNGRGSLSLNERFPEGVDYYGDEFHPDDILHNWRNAFSRFKNRQGASNSWHNAPTWFIPKTFSDNGQILYAWALARMNRGNAFRRAADYGFMNRLNTWEYQMDDRHARPLSETAVLLSQNTIDFTSARTRDDSYYHAEHSAWLQTLAEENVQYSVILDRDIELGRLERYRVLVLPNVAVLSADNAERIRQFVHGGGRVIAIYETGRFDTAGDDRPVSVLGEAMNLAGWEAAEGEARVEFGEALARGMSQPTLTSAAPRRAVRLADPARSQVLASFVEASGQTLPAIVETAYGRGRFYYIAGNLVSQNDEPRMVSGSAGRRGGLGNKNLYPTRFNADINRWVSNLMTAAVGDDYQTRAVKVPPGVIYTAYEQDSDRGKATVIHLLNCQGKPRLAFGEPVQSLIPLPQPPVAHDLEFRVRSAEPIRKAFAVAPLTEGRAEVAVEPLGPGAYTVRVPKEAVENYTVVYLSRGE